MQAHVSQCSNTLRFILFFEITCEIDGAQKKSFFLRTKTYTHTTQTATNTNLQNLMNKINREYLLCDFKQCIYLGYLPNCKIESMIIEFQRDLHWITGAFQLHKSIGFTTLWDTINCVYFAVETFHNHWLMTIWWILYAFECIDLCNFVTQNNGIFKMHKIISIFRHFRVQLQRTHLSLIRDDFSKQKQNTLNWSEEFSV